MLFEHKKTSYLVTTAQLTAGFKTFLITYCSETELFMKQGLFGSVTTSEHLQTIIDLGNWCC